MNSLRITQTASTIAEIMGFSMNEEADCANELVLAMAKKHFGDKKAERVLIYNPDAIALWLYQKYTELFTPIAVNSEMALPVLTVMPCVTPVCFASMYSGVLPDEHGIKAYVKPVLKIATLFDAAIKAGKKPVIITKMGESVGEIFKERDMDYIYCKDEDESNEKALEIIEKDIYDLIVVYNGNYDTLMHKTGPESEVSLDNLKHNARSYAMLSEKARTVWKDKRFLTAFLPDHGCHEIDGECGSHGLDIPEDMDIIHFYSFR